MSAFEPRSESMGWKIPEPLPFDWTMRTVDSARVTITHLADGRLEQRVEHAVLPGITPEMVLWYLEHVDEELVFRGTKALGYRFWHPIDHIYFKRTGKLGPGARWHIVEAFQAQPRFMMEQVFEVVRIGERGFLMVARILGSVVAEMDEQWATTPEGLKWTVVQRLGSTAPVLGLVSRGIIRSKRDMLGQPWQRHNVEECGNLLHVLPELWAAR